MAQITTLQKARALMDSLVKMKINRNPLPLQSSRIYPVASLPNGKLLLSNGQTRETPVMQNLEKIQEKKLIGDQTNTNPANYTSTLALNIAIPAKQTGKDISQQALSFSKYLGSILQPKMAASAEVGAPAIVPQMEDKAVAFTAPSALANLPKLSTGLGNVQGPNKNMFDDFLKSTENFQETLKKEYFNQISRGEAEANQTGFANLPLVHGYGNNYRLPSSSDTPYSKVSSNPFTLTSVVR